MSAREEGFIPACKTFEGLIKTYIAAHRTQEDWGYQKEILFWEKGTLVSRVLCLYCGETENYVWTHLQKGTPTLLQWKWLPNPLKGDGLGQLSSLHLDPSSCIRISIAVRGPDTLTSPFISFSPSGYRGLWELYACLTASDYSQVKMYPRQG